MDGRSSLSSAKAVARINRSNETSSGEVNWPATVTYGFGGRNGDWKIGRNMS